jgi:hypothetical protein
MIPELKECAETEIADTVRTRNDQAGSDKETTIMSAKSATSISWTSDGISPHNTVPFTGGCGIKFLCQLQTLHFHG